MKIEWNQRALLVLRVFISITLLFSIFKVIGIKSLVTSITSLNIYFTALAFSFAPVIILLRSYKWYFVLSRKIADISFKKATISLLAGSAIGLFTPGKIGELSRMLFLRVKEKRTMIGITLYDRLSDLYAIFFLAVAGSLYMFYISGAYFPILLISSALISSLTILLFFPNTIAGFISKIYSDRRPPFFKEIYPRNASITEVYEGFSYKRKDIFISLGLALIIFLVSYLQGFIILKGVGYEIPYYLFVIFFSLIALITVLPISISGIGVREGAAVLILSKYGIPADAAVIFSLVWFLMDNIFQAVLGSLMISYIPK